MAENNVALVVGASGVVGGHLAALLATQADWRVLGLSRSASPRNGVTSIVADLRNIHDVRAALGGHEPTHVFLTTWLRQATEAENIRVNGRMIRNVLDAVSGSKTVRHVGLVTGLKHYLGPFEAYGQGNLPPTPFR